MELDHFNIRTTKLEETVRFYKTLMTLLPGDRPAQPLNGSWLYSGPRAVLHLLESGPAALATGPLDHVAFACTGLSVFLSRMDNAGIPRVTRSIPGTPIVQVQFLDPNGVMLEANFTDEVFDGVSASLELDAHSHLTQVNIERSRAVKVLRAQGIATTYEICGSGPALILIHGAEADRKSFAPLIPTLARHFTCVTYDQRDTGDTTNPPDAYSASDLGDDAAALIASLGNRAYVWGTSYGGMIAQELALRHPACIEALVLSVTFQRGKSALANPEAFNAVRVRAQTDATARHELMSLFFAPQTAQRRPELIANALKALSQREPDARARRAQVSDTFDSQGRAAGIQARTLVLGAMEDRVIDPMTSWRLAQEIPHAQLTLLDGLGHALAFENPARVAGVVTDFLLRQGVS
jgi:pimeloyl-ACP methyl ester carboxylesterase/catechol 2,3-dioxygenase-like lactoylglutathione lyase family enzyme